MKRLWLTFTVGLAVIAGQLWVSGGDAHLTMYPAQPTRPSVSIEPGEGPHATPREAAVRVPYSSDTHHIVEQKYEYLLVTSSDHVHLERVRRLLLERERLRTTADVNDEMVSELSAAAPAHVQADIAGIDAEVATLLPLAQRERFELLKDADVELMQLTQFENGIRELAPLDGSQREALALNKLQSKRQYEALLGSLGLDRTHLSPAERDYAHRTAAQALEQYREQFLLHARHLLTDEQFEALQGFETSEFERALQRLQLAINAK